MSYSLPFHTFSVPETWTHNEENQTANSKGSNLKPVLLYQAQHVPNWTVIYKYKLLKVHFYSNKNFVVRSEALQYPECVAFMTKIRILTAVCCHTNTVTLFLRFNKKAHFRSKSKTFIFICTS